jgi:protein-arginine kinase activator protein McsA
MADTKVCRHCGKEKHILQFESRKNVKGGRSHKCNECAKNRIHVYKTSTDQVVRERKPKREPKVIVYFEHDPYYKF